MGRRTLLLVAALFLAAVGTGVLFVSARGVATTTDTRAGQVDVLAPAQTIPGGTKITEQTAFVTVKVSEEAARQAGMIRARTDLKDRVANRELLRLVPVTSSQFGGAISGTTKVGLDDGYVGMTVELEDPARVADLLVPGDKVAIWVIDPDTRPTGVLHEARLFLSGVEVLTTGTTGTIAIAGKPPEQPDRGSTALVTLQVKPADAGAIMVAKEAGDLYFTLLSGENKPGEQSVDEGALVVPNG